MVSVLEHHFTTVTVSNMDKSLEFYHDYLGLGFKSEEERTGKVFDRLYGAKGARLRSVQLETEPLQEPTRRIVELIQWYSPLGKPWRRNVCDQASTWLGLPIRDLNTLFDNQPPSVFHRFLSPPVLMSPGRYCAFLRDPDGSLVELTNNNHLGITTLDQGKVSAFYRDMLGLKSPAPTPRAPEEWQRWLLTWYVLPKPWKTNQSLFPENQLATRNGRLDIGKWDHPSGRPLEAPLRLWDIGVMWPGLIVKDVEAAYQELVNKGVNFLSAPVQDSHWKACICQDPEGNFVELVERL